VLTEDASGQAFGTVSAFVRHLLLLADPRTQTQCLELEPTEHEHIRATTIANRWKSSSASDRQSVVELLRMIAGKVVEPGGYVFFHFDGDAPWSARDASANIKAFDRIIKEGVRSTLQMRLSTRYGNRTLEMEAAVADALGRLIPIVPFYSIEAWCYQNTRIGKEVCLALHSGGHDATFEQWEQDRTQLDEVTQIKNTSCLGSEHNHRLASEHFPAREVHLVGKSFAYCVKDLASRPALLSALAMTYAWPRPPSTC